jgi:Tol biopolymer transport system component
MKLVIVFLILCSGIVQAQSIKVLRIEQLTTHKDGEFVVSAVSPDGKSILASEPGYKGLYSIDVSLKKIVKVSGSQGAGYEPCFSPDGSSVFFRTDEFVNSKKYSSLLKIDLTSKETTIIEDKSRDLSSPVAINKRIVYSIGGRKMERVEAQSGTKSETADIYVVLENLKPVLYINGIGKPVLPNGEGNYIWASLSPDKTKLLYNFQGTCTYISNLDGSIIANAGRFDAPKWLNDEIIVGMDDKDDGYRVVSSDIIAFSLNTKQRMVLTSTSNKTEMYPFPFPGGDKIVFQTIEGELFIMYLNIR